MSGDFLSDDEMNQLEAQHAAAPDFISDEDMDKLAPPPPAPENPHDLVPFLKTQAHGLVDLAKRAGKGIATAVAHPLDTAQEAGNWMLEAGGPGGDQGNTLINERAVRSLPVVGPAINNIGANAAGLGALASGEPSGDRAADAYRQAQTQGDTQHAQEHPLTDFIQKSAGLAALPAAVVLQVATLATDAFHRSLAEGNDALTAMKDARNTAVLAGSALAAGKAIAKVPGMLGRAAAKEAGVSPETMERYRADPEAVNSAVPLVDQTKKFLGSIDETQKGLSQGSSESFQTLKDLGATLKPETIAQPLHDAAESLETLGNYGPERKGAINYLRSLAGDVGADAERSGGDLNLITWDKGKSMLGVLDNKIEELSARNGDTQVLRALGDARKAIDTTLKETSPEYAAQMAEQAKKTEIYRTLADKFRSDNGAMSTLKRVQTGKDPFAAEALQGYDKQFGTTFGEDLQNSAAKQSFEKSTINGSRKAKVGAGIGGGVGATVGGFVAGPTGAVVGGHIGAAAGGAVGALADRYGGQAVKAALDAGIKLDRLVDTEYVGPIMDAAARGPRAVAVAHYIWAESDPAYQRLNFGEQDDQKPGQKPTVQPAGMQIDNDDDEERP